MPRLIRITRNLSLLLLIVLLLWMVLMIATASQVSPGWTDADYLDYAARQGGVFILNYFNAVLFTGLVVALFGLLYLLLKEDYPLLTLTGLLFVPVYGVMNIVVYASQITILPVLINAGTAPEFLLQWIQLRPDSAIGMVNGLAYAILGLPSICFAIALHGRGKLGHATGDLLILNAIFCILGPIGAVTGNDLLALGTVVGGLVFTIAVFTLYLMLRQEDQST
ncbi:MAG: hypothetical protein ABIA75_06035 [Candidatus Neomarinimicrobiota bacterium]